MHPQPPPGSWQSPPPPGNPQGPGPHAQPAPSRRRAPWIIALVGLLIGAGGVTWGLLRDTGSADEGLTATVQEGTFADPESAVRHFTESLAAHDLEGALESFAGASVAQSWDQTRWLERMRFLPPSPTLDPDDPLLGPGHVLGRWSSAVAQIQRLTASMTAPEWVSDRLGSNGVQLGDRDAAEVVLELRTPDLTGLSVDQIRRVESSPDLDRIAQDQATMIGADEYAEFGVLYSWNGDLWVGGVTALRYGDRWLLWNLTSVVLGTSPGLVEKTTVEDFEQLMAGD